MRPLLLKGHTRPLTCVRFNRDGDLLFTAARDHKPCVWYTHNGERLGTFNGHNGSVYDLDISFDSTRLLTAGADQCAKLWDIETGTEQYTFKHKSMVRSVGFAHGERMILTVQDKSFSSQPTIFIYNLTEDPADQDDVPVRSMFNTEDPHKNINTALWGDLNQTIISGSDDGSIRVWDVETGTQTHKVQAHRAAIKHLRFSKDRTMFITASSDQTSKLFDAKTCQLLKTFRSDRPLNAAAISPIKNQVIIGGGQEAMDVTTTGAQAGHFEVDFHHAVYEEKLGAVAGHFGPVNTCSFFSDGKGFVSGGEDGYVRLYHFDKSYFSVKDY